MELSSLIDLTGLDLSVSQVNQWLEADLPRILKLHPVRTPRDATAVIITATKGSVIDSVPECNINYKIQYYKKERNNLVPVSEPKVYDHQSLHLYYA